MILHITTKKEWEQASHESEYTAVSLKSDGFIHCSSLKQTVDTANIFFRGQKGLVLLCIDEDRLKSECKYEDSCGGGRHDPIVGSLFPHIYGPINISAVIKVINFPSNDDGFFELPGEILV